MIPLPERLLAGLHATDTLGLAVSGGGDSMAMLHLAIAAGLRPRVVTVDHGLRSEAATEAEMVGRIAAGHGLPHDILQWRGWDHAGNLQDAARKARRQLIADWAEAHGVTSVALAHTQDDVAETFLMRLARGAGVDGLAAMSSCWQERGITWQRPMLTMTRAELRDWLAGQGLTWAEDPSNENLRFDRVKARKTLAALRPLGLDTVTLAGVAAHLAEARAALDIFADDWAARTLRERAGMVEISPDLWRAPAETQRRILQRILLSIAPADYAPRGTQVGQLLDRLANGQAATLAGCRFLATPTCLRAIREAKSVSPRVPARALWDGRWRILGDLPQGAETGALGETGLKLCPDWRATGLPRAALLASPALWLGETLLAAPLAGFRADLYSAVPLQLLFAHNSAALSH